MLPCLGFAQAAPEQPLLQRFATAFKSAEPGARAVAVRQLAEEADSSGLGASRAIAAALCSALRDSDDDVCLAATDALASGREPAVVDRAVADYLEFTGKRIREIAAETHGWNVFTLLEKPIRNYARTCQVLGHYRGKAGLPALADELKRCAEIVQLRQFVRKAEESAVDALIEYGTQDSIDAIIEHLRSYYLKSHRDWLVAIHLKLRAFSDSIGVEPVGFPQDIAESWRDWFTKHRGKIRKPA